MKALSYAKMIRIRRVGIFVRNLNVRINIKALFNLLKLGLYLILALHISACLWFNLTQLSKGIEDDHDTANHWIPPYDFLNFKESMLYTNHETQFKLYFIYFYHAVLFLNLNELAPVNEKELMFSVFLLLTASLIYSKMFGDIVVLIVSTTRL